MRLQCVPGRYRRGHLQPPIAAIPTSARPQPCSPTALAAAASFAQAFFKALAEAGVATEWLLLATAVSGDPKQLDAAQWLVEEKAATGTFDCEGRQVRPLTLLRIHDNYSRQRTECSAIACACVCARRYRSTSRFSCC